MVEVTRRTIYLWGKKEKLEPYVIDKVGNAIGIDMRATMPNVFGVGQPIAPRATKKNEPNSAVVTYWKEKYEMKVKELEDLRFKLKTINEAFSELISPTSKINKV